MKFGTDAHGRRPVLELGVVEGGGELVLMVTSGRLGTCGDWMDVFMETSWTSWYLWRLDGRLQMDILRNRIHFELGMGGDQCSNSASSKVAASWYFFRCLPSSLHAAGTSFCERRQQVTSPSLCERDNRLRALRGLLREREATGHEAFAVHAPIQWAL